MGAGASAGSTDRTRSFGYPADARVGFGVSYDVGGTKDVDIQAVAFDKTGKCMGAAFYNNVKALGKGLTHSGDEEGKKDGFDELVWAHLKFIKDDIKLIVFVVAAHGGGCLKDVKNGKVSLLNGNQDTVVGENALEGSTEEVDIVGYLERLDAPEDGNAWMFRELEFKAADGNHFMDIMEPSIGDVVRKVIPAAPKKIEAKFDMMKKGEVVAVPVKPPKVEKTEDGAKIVTPAPASSMKVGLGWDKSAGVDVDVSAVCYKGTGANVEEFDACFFGNQEIKGFRHGGDNQDGDGAGDDETIDVKVDDIDADVTQVIFIINMMTPDKQFDVVKEAHVQLFYDGSQVCKYNIDGTPDPEQEAADEIDMPLTKEGLIVGRFFRNKGEKRWKFQAAGVPVDGRTWKDSRPELSKFAGEAPKEFAQKVNPKKK